MVFEKRFDNIRLRGRCGNVVEFYPETPQHQVNRTVLCDGTVTSGHMKRNALLKNLEVQDEVWVNRGWNGIWHDTYTLYHLNKNVARVLILQDSLYISLRKATELADQLGHSCSSIDGFIAFVKRHQRLSLKNACTRWKFIRTAEFKLLSR
jgi:hypothetical protein